MSDHWSKKVNTENPLPEEILGADVNQSLHHLVGYVWAEGNQKREFPSYLFSRLIRFVFDQHKQAIQELEAENKKLRECVHRACVNLLPFAIHGDVEGIRADMRQTLKGLSDE